METVPPRLSLLNERRSVKVVYVNKCLYLKGRNISNKYLNYEKNVFSQKLWEGKNTIRIEWLKKYSSKRQLKLQVGLLKELYVLYFISAFLDWIQSVKIPSG